MDSILIDDFNIFSVARKRCYSLLEMILDNLSIYNFDIDSQDEETGNTLLHIICSQGKYPNF